MWQNYYDDSKLPLLKTEFVPIVDAIKIGASTALAVEILDGRRRLFNKAPAPSTLTNENAGEFSNAVDSGDEPVKLKEAGVSGLLTEKKLNPVLLLVGVAV